MTKAKTTRRPVRPAPGPYLIEQDRDGCEDRLFIHTGNDYFFSRGFWLDGEDDRPPAGLLATARLLASAPRLLDSLIRLLDHIEQREPMTSELGRAIREARSVVRQAGGRK